ncbi:TPA: hypothetical protein ACKP9T_005078 [Pseudomonas aeruginosa]|uniref:hypothetical protein n=1 Tax=Pseudomonas aeruginosa TaxID=287 RepID=UPI000F53D46A|nr:hypothetical protein [Pseudomonas aeruginosa]MBG5023659.1 hypothetical protein [Pseudomonas aeruginosa]MCT0922913.1 hypothetical protein [Pseudomonas aeruginosa]MCT0998273.1 hypothetical protein [Pseudomonas aeruginosa]MCT1021878.1 hypothetical protein [Pseudomonas aeruginosa]MCT1030009.1 hypothetical protein [Pseudomonas aeruginosa]
MSNALMRFLGIWSFEPATKGKGLFGYWSARANWGEAAGRFGLGLYLLRSDGRFLIHLCLPWPSLFIRVRFLERWIGRQYDCMGDRWGFTLVDGNSFHLNWREKTKIVHLPWSWKFYRWSYLLADGSWVHDIYRPGKRLPWDAVKALDIWKADLPYTYVLRSGEVQERRATISVEEHETRRRWLTWCPLFARTRQSIKVEFSGEVGEGSGSWKGGTYGCGYDMKPGESPVDCLRRMERERKF